MLDLDLENLPRAVRAMKCQALAAELAAMRGKLATAQTDEDRQRCRQASALIEEDIAAAAGTAEERSREAAEALLEGALSQALADAARYGASGAEAWRDRLRGLRLQGSASPYTSEAEEKLSRVEQLLRADSDIASQRADTLVGSIRDIVLGAP